MAPSSGAVSLKPWDGRQEAPKQRRYAPFAFIADALRRQASELIQSAEAAEATGARLNITKTHVDLRVKELRDEAAMIGHAYYIVTALIPFENMILSLIDAA